MSGTGLTPQQVTNRLLVKARRTAADHTARGGRCPICRQPPDCDTRTVALAFIASHGPAPEPIIKEQR